MTAPVEVTTKYATSVDTLTEAWAFVMEKVDTVGPAPSVKINPFWVISVSDMGEDIDPPLRFEVVVEGMVEEAKG